MTRWKKGILKDAISGELISSKINFCANRVNLQREERRHVAIEDLNVHTSDHLNWCQQIFGKWGKLVITIQIKHNARCCWNGWRRNCRNGMTTPNATNTICRLIQYTQLLVKNYADGHWSQQRIHVEICQRWCNGQSEVSEICTEYRHWNKCDSKFSAREEFIE